MKRITTTVMAVELMVCLMQFGVAKGVSPIKLNGPLVLNGDIQLLSMLQFSPDGSRVLYCADQNTDEVFEIFSVPSAGGTPIRLNGTLAANGDVFSGRFSPDGNRVLYLADQDTVNVKEIFSVPSTGGTPIKLNGTLTASGSVFSWSSSPDGNRLLYLADQDAVNVTEIFSVPSTGGTPIKLNGTLTASGSVFSCGFSPDGNRVVYRGDQDADNVAELYSVPSWGGMPVKLNGPLVTNGDVSLWKCSPDGARVLYLADENSDELFEVFTVPTVGGTPIKLNGPLVANGDVASYSLKFSPDGSRVLYNADQETDEVFQVYSVPSLGGTPIRLNSALADNRDAFLSEISPDGSRVLYLADQDTDEVVEIYSVPTAGGMPIKINGTLCKNGNVSPGGLQFSPDGSRVLYLADQNTDEVFEVYSAPSTGGAAVKLNGPMVSGGDISPDSLQFTPDGSRVVYVGDQNSDGVLELFCVPATGGSSVRLNGPLVNNGDVLAQCVRISPDGSRVIYLADEETDGVLELYSRVIQANWHLGGSGAWDTDGNWNNGIAPDEVMQTTISAPVTVTAAGNLVGRSAFSVLVGSGSLTSVLELQANAEITVHNGLTVADNGMLLGDGVIRGAVVNQAGGEVRIGAGDKLRVTGTVSNAGRIEAIGSVTALAEYELDGAFTNTNQIYAKSALFRFHGGMSNGGTLTISGNQADVVGIFANSGTVVLTGNSLTTFYDHVITFSGSEFRIGSGSRVLFLDAVTGSANFTGSGVKIFESTAAPGSLATTGTTIVETTGNLCVPQIRETALIVYGTMTILPKSTTAGTSRLHSLTIDGGSLDLNDNDLILDYSGASPLTDIRGSLLSGSLFSSTANASANPKFAIGYMENITGLSSFGGQALDSTSLLIVYTLRGDSNLDGKVDTLDFNNLAMSFGQPNQFWLNGDFNYDGTVDSVDFNQFIDNYGNNTVLGSTVSLGSPIPEPAGLILSAAMLSGLRRRRPPILAPRPPLLFVRSFTVAK